MRRCVFEREEEEEEEDDDKTVNSERMAGAGRRTRTNTASRRVLGSLSVQECSPFLFFLVLSFVCCASRALTSISSLRRVWPRMQVLGL